MEYFDTPYDRIKSVADAHGISISRIEKDLGFAEKQVKKWKTFFLTDLMPCLG